MQAKSLGAGMLLPTSKACDGAKAGFDIPLTRGIAEATQLPVVASGGAGTMEHFLEAATEGKAQILLAASVFHFGMIKIPELKKFLHDHGVNVQQ
jgi:cyclase